MTDTTCAPKCALQYILYNPKQYANLSFSLTITFAFSLFAVLMIFADRLAIQSASLVLRADPSFGRSSGCLGSTCGLWLRACPALPTRLAALSSCNPCAGSVFLYDLCAAFGCAPSSWNSVHFGSCEDSLRLMTAGFERSFETGSCRIEGGQQLLSFSSTLLSFSQPFCNTACQLPMDLLRETLNRPKPVSWGASIPVVVQAAAACRVNLRVEFYEWLIYWQLGLTYFWRISLPL